MKSSILAVTTLLLSFTFCYAQGQSNNKYLDYKHSNTITFSGTLHEEVLVYYEKHISKRSSFEIGLGKKLGSFSTYHGSLFQTEPADQAGYYRGNIYSLDYKYYFKEFKSSALYISSLLFYKDYAFNKKSFQIYNEDDYSPYSYYENQIRSSKKQVYGTKFLFGFQKIVDLSNSIDSPVFILVDFFVGLGLRSKTFTDYVYAEGTSKTKGDFTTTPLDQPKRVGPDNFNNTLPSLHLGIKLGFNF